jgi:hypothetical protein
MLICPILTDTSIGAAQVRWLFILPNRTRHIVSVRNASDHVVWAAFLVDLSFLGQYRGAPATGGECIGSLRRGSINCGVDRCGTYKGNGPSRGGGWGRHFLGRQAAEMRPAKYAITWVEQRLFVFPTIHSRKRA